MRDADGNLSAKATYLAQYANSPILTALIEAMNAEIDPGADIDAFYDYVWNVATAQGFGLDIWGRIVNIPREVQLLAPADYLGFKEALPGSEPFRQAPFYNGVLNPAQGMYKLTDDAYRVLIMTKALANISTFTAPSVNALLRFMFAGRGSCYVKELGGMAIQYVFNFDLEPWESSVLQTPSLMPRPAGVMVTVASVTQVILANPGTGTWTVPDGCTSAQVELLGAGQSGWIATNNNGGAGGDYAKLNTIALTPGASVSYQIGAGGAATTSATPNAGGDTWFSSSTTACAKGGGSASASIGDVIHAGGASGGSGGGAGAGGPNGPGNTSTSATGGQGDGTFGGAGGAPSNNGSAGTEWQVTPSIGSGGGGGGSANFNGGNGGNYGAGGGGARTGHTAGAGSSGLIVITFTA